MIFDLPQKILSLLCVVLLCESRAVAERKPDLKALDEELKLWFAKRSVALDR